MRLFAAAALVAALALPATAGTGPITVQLVGPKGETMGAATLTEGPRGVLIRLEANGLTPGWHGLHFHEKGDCSSADFKSAGAHLHDPAAPVHGLLSAAGNETGDLPNLWAGPGGEVRVEVFSTFVSLGAAPGRASLADADGSALIIHAGPDDHTSQPIGGAGSRVACGVIRPG